MDNKTHRRPSTWLITGNILWVLCFAGMLHYWYQSRQRTLATVADSNSAQSADDNGQSGRQLKLVPQKDGGFIATEVTDASQDNPWDTEGIEDFTFTDTNGQTLTKRDLIGKPFIIGFVFTSCRGPCPNVTMQMREIQDRLKDYDFNLVTLTVDPERDTIETLQAYGKNHGADFDRWKFLTGHQAEIYGLIHRSFKMPVEEVTGPERTPGFEIIHSRNIMLVDATGRVVGKFDALKEEDMAKLRREIKRISNTKAAVMNDRKRPTVNG